MRMKSLKGNLNAFSRTMYMETEKEYRRLNNQIRKETRNAVKVKEKETAKNVKENPKVFWKYVQSKVKSKPRIPDLQKGIAEDGADVQRLYEVHTLEINQSREINLLFAGFCCLVL